MKTDLNDIGAFIKTRNEFDLVCDLFMCWNLEGGIDIVLVCEFEGELVIGFSIWIRRWKMICLLYVLILLSLFVCLCVCMSERIIFLLLNLKSIR